MKSILITGCSSGFGLETARYFLDRDWQVVATMRTPRKDVLLDYSDPLTQRVASFAASPEELRDLLTRAARGEKLKTGTPDERRALFAANIHVPQNGTASRKVQEFIQHYVDRARRRETSRKLAS